MNILDPQFGPGEAKVRFMDADFVVLSSGTFVRCAMTNVPIAIDDLRYWNVDRQEAYCSPEAARDAYLRYKD